MRIRDISVPTSNSNAPKGNATKSSEELFAEFSDTLDKIASKISVSSQTENEISVPVAAAVQAPISKKNAPKTDKKSLSDKPIDARDTTDDEVTTQVKQSQSSKEKKPVDPTDNDEDKKEAKVKDDSSKEDTKEETDKADAVPQAQVAPVVPVTQIQTVPENQAEQKTGDNPEVAAQPEVPYQATTDQPQAVEAANVGIKTDAVEKTEVSAADAAAKAAPAPVVKTEPTADAAEKITAELLTATKDKTKEASGVSPELLAQATIPAFGDSTQNASSEVNTAKMFEKLILERALSMGGSEQNSSTSLAASLQDQAVKNLTQSQLNQSVGKLQGGIQPSGAATAQGLLNSFNQSGKGAESATSSGEMKEAMKTMTRQQEARTLERVESALKEVARGKDGKTISLRLDPPDLGTLKIDVSLRDGALHARIVAETPQVQNLLKEKAHDLVQIIRNLGLNVEKVSVSVSDHSQKDNAGANASFSGSFQSSSDQRDSNGTGSQSGNKTGVQVFTQNQLRSSENIEDHWVA